MKFEPALIVSMVTAVLAALIAFGVQINDQQNQAIVNLVNALIPIIIVVSGLIIRQNVWSKNSVEKVTGTNITNAENILASKP